MPDLAKYHRVIDLRCSSSCIFKGTCVSPSYNLAQLNRVIYTQVLLIFSSIFGFSKQKSTNKRKHDYVQPPAMQLLWVIERQNMRPLQNKSRGTSKTVPRGDNDIQVVAVHLWKNADSIHMAFQIFFILLQYFIFKRMFCNIHKF